ncbi:GGDEF domain-containing protein [bacterium]|nr:GGDEF domain-containing protein [bacterium]MBU1994358.1 GGDEF domain-containing protein [bacterium]
MQKNELKVLAKEIYEKLLDSIDKENNATKEQLVNYLIETANIISNLDDDHLDKLHHANSLFTNLHQNIADKSLSSYKDTNSKFQELTQINEEALNNFNAKHIDVLSLTKKFNEIQGQMTDEIHKANSVISQLTEQIKTLETESNLDSLTKVFNRRALTAYLSDICSNQNITHELHLLILDIDDFKIINDKYGHIAGDKILIFIANILRKTLRDGDKIFRYGGEEFIIVLNRIDNFRCKSITTRLLHLVSDNKLIYKGENLNVTMSIGTTKFIKNDTPDSLVARADKALYLAKKNGKNQMVSEM